MPTQGLAVVDISRLLQVGTISLTNARQRSSDEMDQS